MSNSTSGDGGRKTVGRGIEGAVLSAMGAKTYRAEVVDRRWIAPHLVSVGFRCDGLLYEDGEYPAAWVRGWFPDIDKPEKLHQRGYTLVDANPTDGTFRIAFLIHSPAGPASFWAQHCQPGDELAIQRQTGDGFDPTCIPSDGLLLAGDAAAWPAITSIVAKVPAEIPVTVIMETHDYRDELLEFPDHPRLNLIRARCGNDSRTLAAAISDGDYRGWQTWVTAEATATRLAKTALQLDHHQNKATMHAQAYWVAGRAMGKQVDAPETASQESTVRQTPVATTPSVLRAARPALIVSGIVQALLSLVQLVPLVLFAELARRLLNGANRDELAGLAVFAFVVLLVGAIGVALLTAGLHVYDSYYSAQLRTRIQTTLSRLPLGWFRDRDSAEVKRLVQADVGAMHYLVTHAVPDLVGAVVTPLAILVYLFAIDWRLGLVLLIPVLTYLVVMFRLAAADKPRFTKMLRYNATLGAASERFISGQRVSRVYGDKATEDLPGQLNDMGDFVTSWQSETVGVKTAVLRLNRPTTVIVLLCSVATLLSLTGWNSAADLLPFLILGTSFSDRLLAASYAIGGLQEGAEAKASLELLFSTPELEQPVEAGPPEGERNAVIPGGSAPATMSLNSVTFSYSPRRKTLFNVDIELVPGGVTAVVGPSGAGKSSVAALLARFWDPQEGAVLLDGTDIRELPEAKFRSQVVAVLQDAQLVRGTVRENITLGHPGASDEQVNEVIAAAYLETVVANLADGIDTVVDRDSLSGGERQRVAIARALLGNPRVVILDEATASADPASEWAIKKGLDRLLVAKTVVVISHQIHNVVHADKIVVMDQGRVVEQGTHVSLVAGNGLYSQLCDDSRKALSS